MPAVTATVVAANTTDVQGFLGRTLLVGYQVFETAGATATVSIHDGTSATVAKKFNVSLAANGIDKILGFLHPVPFDIGIWIERLTGTTQVVLYHVPNPT